MGQFWYIVEERAEFSGDASKIYNGKIGKSISAEIVDILPRNTSGNQEWHNTETVENGVYICRRWCKTKSEAEEEIKFWMEH